MITKDTVITEYPLMVEYRNHCTYGTQVMTVFLQLHTPRFSSFIEWVRDGQRHTQPIVLPVDEILEFCLDAAQRLGRQTVKLRQAHEALKFNPSSLFGESHDSAR